MKFLSASFVSMCFLLPNLHADIIIEPHLVHIRHDCALSVSLLSPVDSIPLNEIHEWRIYLTDADGQPLSNIEFEVNGGMEAHGHALPTQPVVKAGNEKGEYLIQGLKFQMTGLWFVNLNHTSNQDECSIRFDFEVMT